MALEYYGTGRRKTSTVRVFLRPGSGAITINAVALEKHFPAESLCTRIKDPRRRNGIDREVRHPRHGLRGGVSGQAGALRLGIARALVKADPELRLPEEAGLLTRDSAREGAEEVRGWRGRASASSSVKR